MASPRAPREGEPERAPPGRSAGADADPPPAPGFEKPTASPHLGDADSSGGDPTTAPPLASDPPPAPPDSQQPPAAADEPEELTCPITRAMFRDPVFVAGSGNTYERAAIETFWRAPGPRRDPLTNAEFRRRDDARVFTNWDKRREVSAWLAKHPDRVPEGWPSRDVPPPIAPEDEPSRASRAAAANRRPAVFAAAAGVAAIATLAAAFVASTAAVRSDGVPPFVVAARNAERQRHVRPAAKSTAARSTRSGSFESNADELRTPNADASDSDAAYVAAFAESAYAEMRRARPPAGSRVSVRRGDRGALEIVVPPQGIFNHKTVAEMGFAAAWSAFTGAWTLGAARGPAPGFALFSLPFWGVGAHLGFASARAALETTRLVFVPPEGGGATSKKRRGEWGRGGGGGGGGGVSYEASESDAFEGARLRGAFYLSSEMFGRVFAEARGSLADVTGVGVVTHAYVNGAPQTQLELREGVRAHAVGRGLHRAEQTFLARAVRDALRDAGRELQGDDGLEPGDEAYFFAPSKL